MIDRLSMPNAQLEPKWIASIGILRTRHMNNDTYQNLIIGSGAGGKIISWTLASSGQRTAVVERRWIGGSCPNVNCLPSKNEVASARVAYLVRNARQFGITTGPVSIDMSVVRQRKRDMV